jgi:hypothetical protein
MTSNETMPLETTQATDREPSSVAPEKKEHGATLLAEQPAVRQDLEDPRPQSPQTPIHIANGERESGDEKQYPPEPNPRTWAENMQVGVQLRTRREPFEAELAFQDKPSQGVIDFVKDNGFRWNREAKVWSRPVGYSTQAQDRLIASRTYHKAVEMILKEKGLTPQPEQQPF